MEKLTKEDIIKTLAEIKRDAERMHTGNVAHQRVHIMGTAQWLIDEISEGNTVLDPESKLPLASVSISEAVVCDCKELIQCCWHKKGMCYQPDPCGFKQT